MQILVCEPTPRPLDTIHKSESIKAVCICQPRKNEREREKRRGEERKRREEEERETEVARTEAISNVVISIRSCLRWHGVR